MGTAFERGEDNYLFSRGGLASLRLTTQHYVMTERQGWMLHPVIEESLANKKDLKIADLATGNGIWPISLSKSHPNTEIVGLDISPAQFPPEFTRPKNVKLAVYNLFDPVPPEYLNHFDVIHIRLIVAVIYNKDTDVVLSNLLSLLKPGGYIQWDEIIDNALVMVNSSLQIDNTARPYFQRLQKVSGVMTALRWAETIPQSFQHRGFVDVLRHNPPLNPSLLQYESDIVVWSLQELIEFVKNIPKEDAKEEMAKAAMELNDDVNSGKIYAYNWEVVIGRKPNA